MFTELSRRVTRCALCAHRLPVQCSAMMLVRRHLSVNTARLWSRKIGTSYGHPLGVTGTSLSSTMGVRGTHTSGDSSHLGVNNQPLAASDAPFPAGIASFMRLPMQTTANGDKIILKID